MRPLEDLRITAVEQYGAGPFGSVHLADLGAQVINVEDPRTGGDIGRYVPPYAAGEDSLFFETFNRNEQSLSLDISTPAGRQVFEDLVPTSDAVWSDLRATSRPRSASGTPTSPTSTRRSSAAASPGSG